ncbi:MAG: MinD/ParA family protein [Pelotomaculum sp.]|nr:MinD/ParA family protein [Pelotomaculum sp.]
MKVLIYDSDGNRLQLLSEEIMSMGLEPEPAETLDAMSHGSAGAVLVSGDMPVWEEIVSTAAGMQLPVYLVAQPNIQVLTTMKELAKGTKFGVISTFEENAMRSQLRRNLERANIMRPAPGRGIIRPARQTLSQPAINTAHNLPRFGPSPELQARRIRKQRDKGTVRDQIIVVYSPKGGVGKSTYSVNLAFSLATCTNLNARVILVDMDVSFGNVASILGLPHKANLLNWIRGDFKENLADLVYVNQESGLHVLMSPPDPIDAGDINYKVVDKMLSILSKRYDFVIIDTNPALRALHKACFEWADTIVLVGTPQKPTLRDLKLTENVFKKMQIPFDKIKVVINEVPKKQSLRLKDALSELQYDVLGYIPEDPGVKVVENTGGVACLSGRCKDYARAHYEICNRLLGKNILEKPSGFSLIKLFKRQKPEVAF